MLKNALGIIGGVAVLILFGVVGGMENNLMSLTKGVVLSLVCLIVCGLCLLGNAAIDRTEHRQRRYIRRKRSARQNRTDRTAA